MSSFPLHSWRIFSLDTVFWVDNLFFQHLKNAIPLSSGLHGFWWEIYRPMTWMSGIFLYSYSLWGSVHIFYSLGFLLFILGSFYCSISKFTDYFLLLYLHSAVEPVTEFLFCLLYLSILKFPRFFMFSISLLRFSVCFFFICLKHVHDCFLKHFCDGRFKSLSDNFNIWFVFHVSVYWLSFLTPSREL